MVAFFFVLFYPIWRFEKKENIMFLLKCVKTCSKSYYDENKKSEMRLLLLHFTELPYL